MRRICTALMLLATAACMDQEATPMEPDLDPALSRTGMAGSATYQVTVTNNTGGQPFTPPLAVTHRQSLSVFEVGEAASLGVQEIAENGNLTPLQGELGGHKHVADLVIALGAPPPILPGTSRSFTINSEKGAKYVSFVSMLICTNDGFTGLDSVRLPRDVGETSVYATMAYDAGTEINTEDFDDMVPPCDPLTGGPGGSGHRRQQPHPRGERRHPHARRNPGRQ